MQWLLNGDRRRTGAVIAPYRGDIVAGWIKLHRELLDKPIWICSSLESRVILITILLLANHDEKEWIFEGKKYKCLPGQFVTSLKTLSEKSGASMQNVRTALRNFEETYEFLTNKSTNKNRLITVTNWSLYQSKDCELTNKLTSNQQATNKQLTTNKNDKEYKEVKKDPSAQNLSPEKNPAGEIIHAYQKYLNDHNVERQQRTVEYLDKGLDADVIIECIRDAMTGEYPAKYVFGILDKCVSEKVNTLTQYVERKKQHNRKQEEFRKEVQQKKAELTNRMTNRTNFDQREYDEEEIERFYITASNKYKG